MTTLREAAQQALEALELVTDLTNHDDEIYDAIEVLRAALAQEQADPDLSRCPQCNGPADNGHDRSFPPSPYLCTKCMAEPAQEPVAWMVYTEGGTSAYVTDNPHDLVGAYRALALYTAPPRRTMVPLTEEEIDRIDQSIPRHTELKTAKRLFARAVEKASWEKNNG